MQKISTLPAATASIDPDWAWEQIVQRNPEAGFYYGVATTGVFCRPCCSSRRPLQRNLRLFATREEAQAAGFRPCRRCAEDREQNLQRAIERVRVHIEANLERALSLDELGQIAGMSSFAIQKHFRRVMGASPLSYQRALRAGALRQQLRQGVSVIDAIYAAGFNSASRAYEEDALGMTPSRFAQGGRGEQIGLCTAPSRFGWIVVGVTPRGLCWLALAATQSEAEASLRAEFPLAAITPDDSLQPWIEAAIAQVSGIPPASPAETLALDLRGTAFQLRVWHALQRIPRGQTLSYSALARELGDPRATRAVARACATNRVALLVPCHRVVAASGALTGYRWGVERKRQLLETEGGKGF